MHKGNTVFSAIPVPSSLTTEDVSVTLDTNYPFENKLEYRIEARKDTRLVVRVPSFARDLKINGVPTSYRSELSFDISAGESGVIGIEFDTLPTLVDRPHNLKSVKCGSLVFSLPIEYEKRMHEYERDGVERKFPYCDYEYIPKSEWSYGYSSPFFTVERKELSEIPFDSKRPPLVIKAEVKPIAWGLADGFERVCAKTPQSRLPEGEAKTVELYPYGCAKLRMTELPLI